METEKTTQKTATERQAEILLDALSKAQERGGVIANASQKAPPRLYDKGLLTNPVNALIMAMHSDAGEFKTNIYTQFNRTKERGEAIRKGQKGVPFVWTSTNEYVNKENPEDKITRAAFKELPDAEKSAYRVNPKQEVYTLFNIDQSTMPNVHKETYEAQVEQFGSRDKGGALTNPDVKQLRSDVNDFVQSIKDNLVPIRKDSTGVAHYDSAKDALFIPSQKSFDSYNDYVQHTIRLIAEAAGNPARLSRDGFEAKEGTDAHVKEVMTRELSSAVKMIEFGLPAKLHPETVSNTLPRAIELIKEDPKFAEVLLHDVNRTVGMIRKAEGGEKIELKETPKSRQKQWESQLPKEDVPKDFSRIIMLKDDNRQWTLTAKAENEPRFAIHPTKEDVSRFFDVILNDHDEARVNTFKTQFAQKYYAELAKDPSKNVELFKSNASEEALGLISKVNSFKSKDSKVYLVATIADEKQNPREMNEDQWQRLFLADDKRDYRVHLAAILYPDVLAAKLESLKQKTAVEVEGTPKHEEKEHREYHEKEAEEQRRQNTPEAKEKAEQEEKAKEEATKAETKAVAAIALSPMLKQFYDLKKKHPDALLLFRCGDFYETYDKDARKAAEILAITLTRSTKTKNAEGKPLEMAGFPYHALDTYLPKLIRAGQRVAICDQIEPPRQQAQQQKDAGESGGTKQETQAVSQDNALKAENERQHSGMHR